MNNPSFNPHVGRSPEPSAHLSRPNNQPGAANGNQSPSLQVNKQARPEGIFWLPVEGWDDVPDNIRQAVHDILVPAYQRFVEQAQDELERSTGITFVHLLWMEICQQVRMALPLSTPLAIPDPLALAPPESVRELFAQYLQVMEAKKGITEILLKMRMLREFLERRDTVPAPAGAIGLPFSTAPRERTAFPLPADGRPQSR